MLRLSLTNHPLLRLVACVAVIIGCGDAADESTDPPAENTATLCDDNKDNDGDGAKDCEDVECQSLDVCNPDPTVREADVSGMPIPTVDDVPEPSGDAENLVILDWAGFASALSYTFDDTQPSHLEHYDELNATEVRMTFFANNANASDIDAWTQVVEDGHEMGNHTVHHCYANLTNCGNGTALESAEAEIEECSDYIVENFGQEDVWTMASPYGDGGWATPAEQFVFLNRSINYGSIGPNDSSNPFNLPSWALSGGETADDINEEIDFVRDNNEWLIFCIHTLLPTSNSWYADVDIESITGSIDHAKEQGDVWMDSMVNVGAYWMGQKVLSEVTPETDGDNTVWTWTLPDHFPPGKYLRVTVDGGTLTQGNEILTWSSHGYYEVALDAGTLTLAP